MPEVCAKAAMRWHVYRTKALGTIAELVVTDDAVLVASAEILNAELRRIDSIANRFRHDSELSQLNARSGSRLQVSPDLYEAIEVALAMAAATAGLVDPTVGSAMNRLGYDRDFSVVAPGVSGDLPQPQPASGWRSIFVDPERRRVGLPAGVILDLGATAKALAADRAAATIHQKLGCGALVSLGGDASAAGPAPIGGFAIGVADRCTSRSAPETVSISSGGIATSGIAVRHWRLGSHLVHHILDPITCLPAAPCWRTVSTTAASCVQANAASTAAMVLGDRAIAWLESRQLPARLVRMDGTVVRTSEWPNAGTDRSTAGGGM